MPARDPGPEIPRPVRICRGISWAGANSFVDKNGSHLLSTYDVPSPGPRGFISIPPANPQNRSLKEEENAAR